MRPSTLSRCMPFALTISTLWPAIVCVAGVSACAAWIEAATARTMMARWSSMEHLLLIGAILHERAQLRSSGFRRDIALRHGEQLKADHELADRRRAQQRREEMDVHREMRRRSACWTLMDAHRIWERGVEDPV